MKETDLYPPLESWLEENGYDVYAEVKGADIIAEKDSDIIAIELKLHMNLTLILQAVERQSVSDNVYIALPLPRSLRNRNLKREHSLLKRLGLGLIYVNPNAAKHKVQLIMHPGPYNPPRKKKKREAILREISERIGNCNQGGSSGTKIMTAYRQKAIQIAAMLGEIGPSSPAALVKEGAPRETGQILYNNHYGWFEKTGRGIYELDKAGIEALGRYADLADHFREKLKSDSTG